MNNYLNAIVSPFIVGQGGTQVILSATLSISYLLPR